MTKWYFPSRQSLKMAAVAKKQFKAGVDPGKRNQAADLLDEQQQRVDARAANLTSLRKQWQSLQDKISDLRRKIKNGQFPTGTSQALAMSDLKGYEDSLFRLETQDIAKEQEEYDREYKDLRDGWDIFVEHFMV